MIAITTNRPLLQTGHCVISDYDWRWVEHILKEAALRAGTTLPCSAEIAQGIMLYLEHACPLQTVPLEYLFERMRRLLEEIGLPLVAAHLRKQTPPVDIKLDTLAGEAPLPLFFYTALRQRMDSLRNLGLTTYRFSGKKRCSLTLGARRRSCPTQQRALEELDAFLSATGA
ncbi:MAG: hypothetical protein IJB31_05650 [Akkermansia sp.]|nr:hypothetical protein [Akkermansia sp.]